MPEAELPPRQRLGMVLVNGPGVVIVPPGSGCDADCIYALQA